VDRQQQQALAREAAQWRRVAEDLRKRQQLGWASGMAMSGELNLLWQMLNTMERLAAMVERRLDLEAAQVKNAGKPGP
jgi:hypothetical protein